MGALPDLFFVTVIGDEGSPQRRRSDHVFDGIVEPAAKQLKLTALRGDLDPTPGPISDQMFEMLLGCRAVICDLTGRNPNVFYELGIAHGAQMPVVSLVDHERNLPFDVKDERVIAIGDDGRVDVGQAKTACTKLIAALEVVLDPDYRPRSPVGDLLDVGPDLPPALSAAVKASQLPLFKRAQRYDLSVTDAGGGKPGFRLALSYTLVNPTPFVMPYSPSISPAHTIDNASAELDGTAVVPKLHMNRDGFHFDVRLPPKSERRVALAADVDYAPTDNDVFTTYVAAEDFEVRLTYPPGGFEFHVQDLTPEGFERREVQPGEELARSNGPVLAYQGLRLSWNRT